MRIMYEELEKEVKKNIARLNLLAELSPEKAKRIMQESLIEACDLNKNAGLKESIVNETRKESGEDFAVCCEEYNKKNIKKVKQRKKRFNNK